MRVKSVDIVEIQSVLTNNPKRLEAACLPPDQVVQSLRDIEEQVKDKGPGGHVLTGPIYIEDAQPDDVLEVKILSIKLAIPYAYNAFGPGRGYLPDDFPYAKIKIIPLDGMLAHFAPGIDIPLPFSAAWATRGKRRSLHRAPPWIMAGNLDNKDLAGTTPISGARPRRSLKSGHAPARRRRSDITALETSLVGTFNSSCAKICTSNGRARNAHPPSPWASMTTNAFPLLAVFAYMNLLLTNKNIPRDEEYMLASVSADLHITELVDGNKGVHMMIPKSIFTGAAK